MILFDTNVTTNSIKCDASSYITSIWSLFINVICKPLKEIIISEKVSSPEVSGIRWIKLNIINDNNKAINLQINEVLHLKDLSYTLLSL